MHVGRFTYAKNHQFLIDVFQEINKINPKSKLFLVGDGELKNEILKKVSKINLLENVKFLNNRNDVYRILQGMDVFVFPSNFEGLPIAMIEAQASGLPIFASTNISQEVKISSLVRFISLSKRPNKWAKIILNKDEYIQKREKMGKIITKEGYDIIDSARKISEIYCD